MSTYTTDTDSFTAAISQIVKQFVAMNPSIGSTKIALQVGNANVTVSIGTAKRRRAK